MGASDARPVPLRGVAFRLYLDIRKSDGTLITSWAGQDTKLSQDGGNYADATNEATEIQTSGTGYVDLTAGEMNYDSVIVKTTVTNTGALPYVATLYPEEAGDIRADATAISGDSTAADNLEKACDGTTYNIGGGAIVAASVTGNVTGSVGSVASYGTLVADIWAALTSGMSTVGSIGKKLADWVVGTLADDAITAAKFDETTAYPLTSADTGSTAVARTGADGDTLETLSDQVDGVSAAVWVASGRTLDATYDAAKSAASQSSVNAISAVLAGITSLAQWLRGLARKSAMDATARAELNAGGGTYNEATDSQEAQAEAVDAVPTAAETDAVLSAAHGAGSWEAVGTGSGARTITVTVRYQSAVGPPPVYTVIQNAVVRLTLGVTTARGVTNVSGECTLNVDDGTWTVACSAAGFDYGGGSLVVTADGALTITMTQRAIPEASDPARSTCWLYTRDEHDVIEGGVTLTFQIMTHPDASGVSPDGREFTETSDAVSGLLTFEARRGARIRGRRRNGEWELFTVAAAATTEMPQILGR